MPIRKINNLNKLQQSLFDLLPSIFSNSKNKNSVEKEVKFSQSTFFETIDSQTESKNNSDKYSFEKIKPKVDNVIELKNNKINTIYEDGVVLNDYLCKRESISLDLEQRYIDNIKAIELVNKLEEENILATPKEQYILSKYSGFNGLEYKIKDEKYKYELKELLGGNFSKFINSIDISYNTPYFIGRFIYNAIKKLGFDSGRILDPNGSFNKLIDIMPEEMYFNSKITVISSDIISSKIAKHLNQSVNIINDNFEDINIKNKSFDLVISNLCNINRTIQNSSYIGVPNSSEEFYVAKSIDMVRDGGILALIVTRDVLDSPKSKLREYMNDACELLASIRLPYNAFANDNITTDILFLKKSSLKDSKNNFLEVRKTYENILINEYYYNDEDMMIGNMKVDKLLNIQCCKLNDGIEFDSNELSKMLKYIPLEVYECSLDDLYMYDNSEIVKCTDDSIRENEFILIENNIYQRQGTNLLPKYYTGIRREKFINYINLKDSMKNLVIAQMDNCSDLELSNLQEKLNYYYDMFVSKYDYINNQTNKKILSEDIMYYLVSCLEINDNYDEKIYHKSEMFNKRMISLSKGEIVINTINDAIRVSYNDTGTLSIPYISDLMKSSPKDIIKELREKREIYFNPQLGRYESKEDYLSGNVRDKLNYLYKYFKNDVDYKYNIEDLEFNQPKYVGDVYFDISSTWIPIEIKEEFIRKTLNLSKGFKLTYSKEMGYKIVGNYYVAPSLNEVEWGTRRRNALDVVISTMNMTTLSVTDLNTEGKYVKNPTETQAAMEKQEKWRIAFEDYIKDDVNRHKELLDIYNKDFIKYKEKNFENIFTNLRVNPTIHLKEHQLIAASRIITSKYSTLLAHSVGLGKTYSSVCGAMEWKRIGEFLENHKEYKEVSDYKPIGTGNSLFVIPNALCESGQFARDFLKLYPYANILALTGKDFSKANRRRTLAKMKYNKWDSIIIPHQALKLIKLKPITERKMIEENIKELEELKNYYTSVGDYSSINSIGKLINSAKDNLRSLFFSNEKSNAIYFEDLNVDKLIVDEYHHFKNLAIKTKLSGISGVANAPSEMAIDLEKKIRYHRSIYGEKGIVLLSATPISNSMSELYVVNEYIGKGIMHENGIYSFDEWASRFGKVINSLEADATGTGYKYNKRFAKFYNVPELITLFRMVSDVVFTEDVRDIKLPKIKEGKAIVVTVEPTEEMSEYVDSLVRRAEVIWNGKISPKEDNMLKITGEGRALAVSPYLMGVKGDSPKIKAICENIYKEYKEDVSNTHLVFCDLGTPKSNSKDKKHSVYDEIKENLVKLGIDENEIAYIHDGNTESKRKSIIQKFNNGDIKILIGSSDKMGEGVNLQEKLKSCHHVDCPWKPSQIFQREGRIVRQGNPHEEVSIYRYVVKSTFDVYSWQTVERKASFINQVMANKTDAREIEDIDNQILSFAEAKACASGDDRIRELYEISSKVQKLQLLEKAFHNQQIKISNDIKYKKENINVHQDTVELLKNDLDIYRNSDKMLTLKEVDLSKIQKVDSNIIDSNDNLFEEIDNNASYKNNSNFKTSVDKLQEILTKGYQGNIGNIGGLDLEIKRIVELNKVVNKCFVGSVLSFSTKRSAKEIMSTMLFIEEVLLSKIDNNEKAIEKLVDEIKGLEKVVTDKFKEKDELNKLLLQKANLENELTINNDKIYDVE